MIGTAAAILGAAVIGGGASLLAGGAQADAAQHAADLNSQATAAAQAEQQREFDLARADNAPARQIGTASLSALGSSFGLSGYGSTPSMTSRPIASTPVPNAGGIMINAGGGGAPNRVAGPSTDKATGNPGVDPAAYANTDSFPMTGGVTGTPQGAPASPGVTTGATSADGQEPDWTAYIAQHPDVQAWIAAGHGDPNLGPSQTPEQAAQYQWENSSRIGQPEPPPPMKSTAVAPTDPNAPPPGYSDPTATGGYTVGPRPASMTIPGQYQAPGLDLSSDAFKSAPGYAFGLQAGQNAQDHVASAGGGLMSGARIKAATRYAQDYEGTKYDDWRNATTQQYNADRAFNYGAGQDAITQANLTQARSDGLYSDDRSYDASRYDTRNNQLLTLAGFGNAANASNAAAGSAFATNQTNLLLGNAAAKGSAGVQAANAYAGGVNNLMTTGAYLGGQYLSGGFGGGTNGFMSPQGSYAPGTSGDTYGLY